MSGHNRWTKIKHKKAAQGAAKGKLFTKLIEIPDALLARFVQG
jgi:transcriptional/translational regulatory protein YebC/TACO1